MISERTAFWLVLTLIVATSVAAIDRVQTDTTDRRNYEAQVEDRVVVEVSSSEASSRSVRRIPAQHWHPSDECARVSNPAPVFITDDTWRWCPIVANHLAKYHWHPGDLFRLLIYMECESNGDPTVVNTSSGTLGLYQFRPLSWHHRSHHAGHAGAWDDAHNNIGTALWLVKSGHPSGQPMHHAWNGCDPKVQSTFRNGGL